jgi:beta-galactosidase GanA
MRTNWKRVFFRALLAFPIFYNIAAQDARIPYLGKQGTVTRMMVDGKPFLMLAGELGNSSASSLDYMRPIWPKLEQSHLNTLLVPVYWEMIEPGEGKYDFILVDSMMIAARNHGIKIVFLWFGSWKNSMSCYAPLWVKTNTERFPRARKADGTPIEILTPFNANNCEADKKVFVELMKHIREMDSRDHTVIMVQVENEIGMIPEARDYSTPAEAAFKQPVPASLMNYLNAYKSTLAPALLQAWKANGMKTSGNWEEVFGKGLSTDEMFMAWHYAVYTNTVAEAGKAVYPLPMYVNAALIREGYQPGRYPSAGPLPHLMDIWRAGAPAIDFLSPDIYFPNFTEWAARYDCPGNPLFIPEVGNYQSMAQAFYAFARHNAMGYSPFSIESVADSCDNHVARAYKVLEQITPLILQNQGKGTMAGFVVDSASQKVQVQLGSYIFTVKHEYSWAYASHRPGNAPAWEA